MVHLTGVGVELFRGGIVSLKPLGGTDGTPSIVNSTSHAGSLAQTLATAYPSNWGYSRPL